MPELPEVETTKRGIAPHIEGRTVCRVIIRQPQLRWPVPQELPSWIEGNRIVRVERRGKYLLLRFNHGTAIWHLGMSGSLRIANPRTEPGKHDHVEWTFGDDLALRYNDPRRFGCLLWTSQPPEQHKLLCALGPEPLTDAFDGTYLYQKSRECNQAVKTWLMNSKIVVGVGNIYANEALYASGIHPLKLATRLTRPKCHILAEHVKRILSSAIERGGTTLRDFVGGDGKPGYFAQQLNVYGRGGEPCNGCAKPLTEKRLGQRTTVYCIACQR